MVYDFCRCVSALLRNVLLMTVIEPEGSSRDSSIGIGTRYGLNDPGIESRWGARFTIPVQTDREAHSDSYTMGTGSLSQG
jgi:hypothetical protein